MTKAEFGGVVRAFASAGFGYLAGKGMIDGETAVALSGAVAVLATALWSVRVKRR